jgi:hypothetical protein
MNKERNRQYKQRIDQALATPKLQEALHRFAELPLRSQDMTLAHVSVLTGDHGSISYSEF